MSPGSWWVDIPDPDAAPGPFADPTVTGTASGPFRQARAQGGLRMARGEGAVWVLDLETMRLTALLVSTNALSANNPDNITVSPRGGVVLCEDGGGVNDAFGFGERMLGIGDDGESYIFCKNNANLTAADVSAAGKKVPAGDYRGRELAGACFEGRSIGTDGATLPGRRPDLP